MEKYSTRTMEPPHEFDVVGEFEIEDIERDENGESPDNGSSFCVTLHAECRRLGYTMRFYSSSREEGYKYKVVVYGAFERTDKYKREELRSSLGFMACMAYCNDEVSLDKAQELMKIPDQIYPK